MTNPETQALSAVLTVTVETRADGIYYVDQADLARHVKGWLEEALHDRDDIEEVSVADAVLPALLAPVDQAAVWREAADDLATAFGDPMAKHIGALGAAHLRRRAREIEAGQTGEDQPETPLEKRLRYSERRNDELRTECKRRGKNVLEQSEKIIALEREIDEVRRQLGAEILRAGQAEAELRRPADEEQPVTGPSCPDPIECGHEAALGQTREIVRRLAAHAGGFQDVLDDSDRDPWARTVGADIAELCAALTDPQPAVGPCVAGEQQNETPEATLAAALDGLHTLIATSSRDWGQYRVDAWLWAVLCGWDCEEGHEHDELCDDGAAMREMAAMHGWDDDTVAKARRYRAAVRALTKPAAGVRQDGAQQ